MITEVSEEYIESESLELAKRMEVFEND